MKCPKCRSVQLMVVDSRPTSRSVYRRRKCLDCGHRFSTYEISQDEYDKIMAQQDLMKRMATLKDLIDQVCLG